MNPIIIISVFYLVPIINSPLFIYKYKQILCSLDDG